MTLTDTECNRLGLNMKTGRNEVMHRVVNEAKPDEHILVRGKALQELQDLHIYAALYLTIS